MSKINWQRDIEQIRTELPKLHRDFFAAKNEGEFNARLDNLRRQVGTMDTYRLVMELARIIGTAQDAHTALMLPRYNRLPFDCYPFSLGLYITATNAEHQELLHCKIVKIEDCPVDAIYKRLSEVIPHENWQFVLSSLPSVVICADILYGTGVISNLREVVVTVTDAQGKVTEHIVKSLEYEQYQALNDPSCSLPVYRQNRDKSYWSSFGDGVFYINYNKCREMEGLTVSQFSETLKAEISRNNEIEKIAIDFRHNSGGNSELFKPFLAWLSHNTSFNQRGKLFVIVGRDTFSSAALNVYYLKFNSKAIFVGEPTGAKPNHFGEVKYLELKSSGLMIRYATKYYELVEDDSLKSFKPDIECEVSFKDYAEGIDRCMEAIRQFGAKESSISPSRPRCK